MKNALAQDGKAPDNSDAKQSSNDSTSQGKPDPAVFHDLWQAAKYSAVQQSYDGLSQIANHFGADIAARKLVEKPQDPTSNIDSIAQTVGYGLGKTPALVALYLGTKFGAAKIAEATAGSLSLAARTELSAGQLAVTAAVYDGLTTKSSDNNFWTDRGKAALITGSTFYVMGRTQLALQSATGLIGAEATSGLLPALTRRAGNAGLGLVSGGLAGAVNAETRAAFDHRPATLAELGKSAAYYGTTGFALGAVLKPASELSVIPKRTGLKVPPLNFKNVESGYEVTPRMKLPPLETTPPEER